MRRQLLFFIFPAVLFAGSIDISFKNHSGKSYYIVNSYDIQNLESKLIFPFNFNSIDFKYKHKLKYFNLCLYSSFLITSKIKKGKDYDWQNNNLTVYSKSDNKIEKYYDIGIILNKNIFNNIGIFVKFNYKILDIYWSNTYQEDYIKNINKYISGNTLKFQQEFFNYYLGINYKKNLAKNISLTLKPSLVFAYINTKDTHILRDFYTIQNSKSFGYEINCVLKYNLTIKSSFKISINYINLEDKNTDMNYYNELNEKYSSYPSSYNYKNTTIGFHYNYSF